jgi:hypothetical protein
MVIPALCLLPCVIVIVELIEKLGLFGWGYLSILGEIISEEVNTYNKSINNN